MRAPSGRGHCRFFPEKSGRVLRRMAILDRRRRSLAGKKSLERGGVTEETSFQLKGVWSEAAGVPKKGIG